MIRVIGYAYGADVHCPTCAFNDAATKVLRRQPPLHLGVDEHGLALDLIDSEDNPVHAIFETDEGADLECCGDCGEKLI